jgi:hypothetical protein
MLHRFLQIVCSGGAFSLKQVAQQLDVSEALVESMIDELVRMGYLRPLEGICIDHCNGCPMAGTCSIGGSGRVWALTEAGKRIVQSGAS